MSAIEAIGPNGIGRLPRRSRAVGADGFSVDASPNPEPGAARTVQAGPATPVGMLALQEIAADPVQDRSARRHGRALLAALARLQRHLLGGSDQAAALRDLTDLARTVPAATDPALAATLQAITLRARVELARRGH